MKKLTLTIAALAVAFATSSSFAGDKEITVKGEGQCGKCSLKETESCQNVIVSEADGKKTTYYLVQNDVSKSFHKNLCSAKKAVQATGSVKETDGKKQLTVSKIELAAAK